MDISSEIHDNSYAEIMQHSLLQGTISRNTISVGTPTITADRFGIGTRYYNRSEQPRPTVKPLDEIKLDLLDNIRTVKDRTDLYMILSKSMRELQF